jgi:DNA helicase MCM8
LAAANPIGGHYNRAKTVSENLKLGPALLSRFDLVFILIDRPDLLQDSLLSDHVMALHTTSAAGGEGRGWDKARTGKGDGEEGNGSRTGT